jgi:hypothetical protein
MSYIFDIVFQHVIRQFGDFIYSLFMYNADKTVAVCFTMSAFLHMVNLDNLPNEKQHLTPVTLTKHLLDFGNPLHVSLLPSTYSGPCPRQVGLPPEL